MDRELLESQLAELPLYGYFFVDTSELEFSERIRYICEHECPMYGKTWACPPGTGMVPECEAKCRSYKDALMIATITEVFNIADIEETLATRPEHEEITKMAADMVRQQCDDVYVLSSEACAICEECAYPDGPCRHPELMNPCVESHGIILTALAEKYGIEFQYGGNIVTWFSLIFYK
ncbi:MAG: DUF2284 domain-containing protein [Oscillospiraceae bacterium]|nr:DUF2284 domain-containing protein [Oscillospiraceae bacterium]